MSVVVVDFTGVDMTSEYFSSLAAISCERSANLSLSVRLEPK